MAETAPLPLDRLMTMGTQARVTLSEAIIREYAEALTNGDEFPPIDVYYDDTIYWLADGFHRVRAAILVGHATIAAVIRTGGQREALLHAVSANETHGYRRTDADRRHAVSLMLADPEWQAWNNSEIARQCRVSEFLVRTLRHELETQQDSPEPSVRTRKVQRGDTTYTMRTDKIGSTRGSKKPPAPSLAESDAEPVLPNVHAHPHEGSAGSSVSSIESKTDLSSAPELYVHEEETPAGPVVPTQMEPEITAEPTIPPPQLGLIDLWQQASTEERQLFVAMYDEELRRLLAAREKQTRKPTRPSTTSPGKQQRRKAMPS